MGKKSTILIGIISAAILFSSNPTHARDTGQKASPNDNIAGTPGLTEAYGRLPLYFVKNNGQADGRVRYYEKGAGHAVYFTDDGLYINLLKRTASSDKGVAGPHEPAAAVQSEVIRFGFAGTAQAPRIEALDRQQGKVNYFIGNDKAGWRTGVPTYGAVVYKNAYKGIDVKYYGNNNELEYDVIVRPGQSPSAARFYYEGVKGLKVNNEGGLETALEHGTITQKRPLIYQTINGRKVEVKGGFEILGTESGRHLYGFQVASYDKGRDLIIDPSLVFSTYLGGGSYDYGNSVAVDSTGSAYIVGQTASTDFPLAGPAQAANGGDYDVFVTKLAPAGNALVYSTYLGGAGGEQGYGIAVDSAGNAYVTGQTDSANFPTAAPLYGANAGVSDAFITKIDPTGGALVYSTYLGGTKLDYSKDIALDSWGNAYVTGYTASADFPTVSPLQASQIQTQTDPYGHITYIGDGFVAKLNAAGSALSYSTFLGGTSYDYPTSIAAKIMMDAYGNISGGVFVTGYTASTNFPTAAPFYATNSGSYDAFVTKYNASGSALLYSTYLGGAAADYGYAITVDNAWNAYITGSTYSTNFPTATPIYGPRIDPYGSYLGDAFVTKINSTGSALSYSTYLGGTGMDYGFDIAVDGAGNAYVTGDTSSLNFPVASPLYPTLGGAYDVFITKLNSAGSALSFSTYLGGSGNDYGRGVAVDASSNVYVAGNTYSTNFPTAAPLQPANAGLLDVFAAKLAVPPPIDLVVSAFGVPSAPAAVTLAPGVTFLAADTTANTGSASSGVSTTKIYLSVDANITTADTWIGLRNLSALAPGASSSGAAIPLIPASTPAGTYYLGAYADATNTNAETNESNNTMSKQVMVGGYADLVISAISGPASAARGTSVSVTNTAKNNGTATLTNFNIRFYLSTDRAITTSDIYLGVRYVNTVNLPPGGVNTQATSLLIPSTVTPRKYYLGAIVDVGNAIPESNEANNTRYYGPMTIN